MILITRAIIFSFIFKQQHRYTRCCVKCTQVDSSNCEEIQWKRLNSFVQVIKKSCFVFSLLSLSLKNASLIHVFFFFFLSFFLWLYSPYTYGFIQSILLILSGFIRSMQSKTVSPITVYLSIYVSIYFSNWQGLVN